MTYRCDWRRCVSTGLLEADVAADASSRGLHGRTPTRRCWRLGEILGGGLARPSCRWWRLCQDQHDRTDEQHPADAQECVAHTDEGEAAADADEEQHAGKDHGDTARSCHRSRPRDLTAGRVERPPPRPEWRPCRSRRGDTAACRSAQGVRSGWSPVGRPPGGEGGLELCRKRRSAIAIFWWLSEGVGDEPGVEGRGVEVRRLSARCSSARLASVRLAEAAASCSRDSVPHLAAAKPVQAAVRVTSASTRASAIWIARPRRSADRGAGGRRSSLPVGASVVADRSDICVTSSSHVMGRPARARC